MPESLCLCPSPRLPLSPSLRKGRSGRGHKEDSQGHQFTFANGLILMALMAAAAAAAPPPGMTSAALPGGGAALAGGRAGGGAAAAARSRVAPCVCLACVFVCVCLVRAAATFGFLFSSSSSSSSLLHFSIQLSSRAYSRAWASPVSGSASVRVCVCGRACLLCALLLVLCAPLRLLLAGPAAE